MIKMEGWPISCYTDNLDALKRNPPPTQSLAFAQLCVCIRDSALVCLAWVIRTWPAVVNEGMWNFNKPLEQCVSAESVGRGKYVPDMVLMLLQAGAQHTQPLSEVVPGIERGDVFAFFMRRSGRIDREHWVGAARHLIDYGAWVNPWCSEVRLRDYWCKRLPGARARCLARKALFIALRHKGLQRDVAKLVLRSAPLSDALSWKEWCVDDDEQ